jgi:hypothetical protein
MRMNTEDVTMTDKEKKETSQQNSHYIYPFASTLLIQIDFQFPMIFTPISHFSSNKFTSSSLQQNTYKPPKSLQQETQKTEKLEQRINHRSKGSILGTIIGTIIGTR